MPKPQWLKDREAQVQRHMRPPDLCCTCRHYGTPVGKTRHKGKELVDVWECALHPKCLNTKYSVSCDDYESALLV